jgi:hypothetical protein
MSRSLEHRATLPAEPARVIELLTDEDFLREYAEDLGAGVDDVEVRRNDGVARTRVAMRTPTAGIPDLFRRLVGREVGIVDCRVWTHDGDGSWVADVEVRAEVLGRSAVVSGQQLLAASSEGSVWTTTAEASVNAPIIGRQAEAAVRELVLTVLRREATLLGRRLTAD